MKSMFLRSCLAALISVVTMSSLATAQLSPEQITSTNKILQQVKATIDKLPASHRQMLDGYANIRHLADVWQVYGMRLAGPPSAVRANSAEIVPGKEIVPVSDPSTDMAYSAFAGFTQSTTSTAQCGDSVVVAYNDSGSVFETPYYSTGAGGESFSGSSYSTNGGASFTDIGAINPGPTTYNFLGGDPVVTCGNENTFYVTQIFNYYDSSLNPWAAVSINTSTDGGKTWGDPIPAISKSGNDHLLDKPWSAVDPSNHKHIFVSYTDFDYTQTNSCGTNFPTRTAVEFVESWDGGVTWSATPNIAIEVCGAAGVQASQLAVSSKGTLYLSWLNLGNSFPLGPRSIQVSRYANGILSTPVTADSAVQPGGDSYYLQGEFRDDLDLSMSIDHSGTSTDGALYIAWADGRDKEVSDPLALQGFYAYDDVFLRASFDGGNTWGSAVVKVNSDAQPVSGIGHDHYQPGVAVDKNGTVAVCWYDRRADAENFAIRRHCGKSTNKGASFLDWDIGMAPFAPTHGSDQFMNNIDMGSYDQLTSDFMNSVSGFIGAFQNQTTRGNPDVYARALK